VRKISECSECFKEHIGLLLEIEIERLIDVTNDPDWRSMILQDWQTGVFALRGSEILFFTRDAWASVTYWHCKYNTT
jgi:hypothetical protein